MIKLYQFRPAFGLPNASPFCMKVENYLRMAGLAYECPRGADMRKAPKGKMPYIEDEGSLIADSSFIIDHLKRKYGDPLDATAYAFIANVLWVPYETPLKSHAQRYPQLEAYCQRMKQRYYSQ